MTKSLNLSSAVPARGDGTREWLGGTREWLGGTENG